MKRAQVIVLGIAAVAGLSAAYLASRPSPAPAPVVVQQAPSLKTVEVLVAADNLPMGTTLNENSIRWQAWPAETASAFITRDEAVDKVAEVKGSIARIAMIAGEPIRNEKLIKADGSGFMSAILPSGKRAIAISIDKVGNNTAGNFILPNDRVDVIRTYRDDDATRQQGRDVFVSETILRNIRVLAIGPNVQEQDGAKVIVGDTATLELSLDQAETITLAQRVGQLSLALRSLADADRDEAPAARQDSSLTVVRFGVTQQTKK